MNWGDLTVVDIVYSIDTLYFLLCGALVMWMAAGFSMLEAGLVRAKNTTEILTKNVSLYAIACVMYMLCGYGIMYGDSLAEGSALAGYIPSFSGYLNLGMENARDTVIGEGAADILSLADGGQNGDYYSGMSDFFFQVVFVATAMSIVSGAVAERMKLWAFLLFAVVMTGVIYPLQGYWSWGGGFLDAAGFSDFAGSGIVHLCGAAAALSGVILLGARKGKYGADGKPRAIPGANLPLATLGMFILWLGWFGFNGGSELRMSNVNEANATALVFVNTNMAAAGGLIAALLFGRLLFGKADLTMAINGALAGLVAITAEPGDPSPLLATGIGAIGGILVVGSIILLDKLKIDDPVGAISVHGTVGIWGVLAVLLSDPDATLGGQLLGLAAIFVWTFVASFIVWMIIKVTIGLRVSEEEEMAGVDISECGMEAYPEFTKQ